MHLLNWLILCIVLYFIANLALWGYQEFIHYDDIQTIRSLDTSINIANTLIEEKRQALIREKNSLDREKEILDKFYADKKFVQYNELIGPYNASVDKYNTLNQEYDDLINAYNVNTRQINELLKKAATRKYIFPIPSYVPDPFQEIN